MTVATSLDDYRAHLLASSLYAKWRQSNPRESAAVNGYWDGGARPTTIRSEFGLAFLSAADAWVQTVTPLAEPMPYPLAPIE